MIDKNISQQLSLTLDAAEIRKFSERKKLFLSGRLLCEKNLIQSLSFALPGGKISSAIIREDSGLQIFSASLFVENKFEPQKLALYVLFELNGGQSVASILVVNEITTNSIHFENTEFESDNQKLANNLLKNSVQLNHNLSDASDLAVVFSASLAREDLSKSFDRLLQLNDWVGKNIYFMENASIEIIKVLTPKVAS